jgi:hypothetical protein
MTYDPTTCKYLADPEWVARHSDNDVHEHGHALTPAEHLAEHAHRPDLMHVHLAGGWTRAVFPHGGSWAHLAPPSPSLPPVPWVDMSWPEEQAWRAEIELGPPYLTPVAREP